VSVVLDTSVIVQILFPERFSRLAAALYRESVDASRRLVAPAIQPAEVVNVIRRRMRRERLTLTVALNALDTYLAFSVTLRGDEELYRQALRLTEAHSLGGHDALYVALAQSLGCDLWTDDQRVLRAIGGRLPLVKWIGDYAPPKT
jgi:predicted nucleic acid-binding protein